MMGEPKPGATKWTREGIEPAKAHWTEAEAYRKAINDRILEIPDEKLQLKLLQLINSQGSALTQLRDALHTLEVIGIEAKKERTNG